MYGLSAKDSADLQRWPAFVERFPLVEVRLYKQHSLLKMSGRDIT